MIAPLLDTHTWVWWIIGDPRLHTEHRQALDSLPPDDRPWLATISLWEVSMLVDLGRLHLDTPLEEWFAMAAHTRTVRLLAITPAVATAVASLPDSFHRDSADRIIVATSRVRRVPLLTYDRKIRDSELVVLAP